MPDGFPGDATQQQIDDQLLAEFRDQATTGSPAPVIISQATAELLLKMLESSFATGNAPVVTSLSPTTTNTGSQNLSVRGNGFTAQSKVVFDGTQMGNTVFKDAGWLQSQVSAPPGTYDVLVHDPAGDSNALQFQFK